MLDCLNLISFGIMLVLFAGSVISMSISLIALAQMLNNK